MMLPAGTPGMMLTPGGNNSGGYLTNAGASEAGTSPSDGPGDGGDGGGGGGGSLALAPPPPASWDMCGTEFAVSQMAEALERVWPGGY